MHQLDKFSHTTELLAVMLTVAAPTGKTRNVYIFKKEKKKKKDRQKIQADFLSKYKTACVIRSKFFLKNKIPTCRLGLNNLLQPDSPESTPQVQKVESGRCGENVQAAIDVDTL